MLHLLKTIENKDFEMALISDKNKELLQMYQLDGRGQQPFYGLQRTSSHNSR
jgi:peroxiredoxin